MMIISAASVFFRIKKSTAALSAAVRIYVPGGAMSDYTLFSANAKNALPKKVKPAKLKKKFIDEVCDMVPIP